jgi:ATP-binding cassette subfamily G (WHITE) protein 2 (PDR)
MGQHEEEGQRPGVRLGISFCNLSVYGINSATQYQPTVTSYCLNLLEFLTSVFRHRTQSRSMILKGFDGLVRSGEMLLVLGRPGSGCSTLLKTLAGETRGLHVDENAKIEYGGKYSGSDSREYPSQC